MAHMSRRFNFDDFNEQIAEALADNEAAMAEVVPIRRLRPGEIGGVAAKTTVESPEPPEAA